MSKGTKQRSIRIDEELWDLAVAVAKARGESLSEVLREALRRYVGRAK